MAVPSFHILIATTGRESLLNMLNSLKSELTDKDAITIIFDGEGAKIKSRIPIDWFIGHKSMITIKEQIPNLGYWGHGVRNKYQGALSIKTTFIMNADDDDTYVEGSFNKLRNDCIDPDILYIAKFTRNENTFPSQKEKIKERDIGTPCGIIPYEIANKAIWELRYGGDYEYYNKLQTFAKSVNYIDYVIYRVNTKAIKSAEQVKIRLHIPGIPYTITRPEFSHDAFTGKVLRFSRMMRSRGFEVYHYGVETSVSEATKQFDIMTKEEWTDLRIKSWQFIDKNLSLEDAIKKNNDDTQIVSQLSNWSSPLSKEFNIRFRKELIGNYRSNQTDIVCIPLSKTYEEAIDKLNYVVVEIGIGYSGSYLNYRIFESYSWMANTLAKEDKQPNNYWFVIPHFFDTNEFQLSLKPLAKRIGYMGRITDLKGCRIIMEIARRFPDYEFVICGQGDPTSYLSVPNIVYKKPIHGSERSEYLGSCIAFLHLAKYLEPFGCGPVEAQLCGTPVISTDWGGMVETVEQFKTGLRGHTLADFCYGVQMAIDGKFNRQYIRDRAVRLYDMYNLANNYEYALKSILDVNTPGKNGWYAQKSHISLIENTEKSIDIDIDMIYYINLDKRKDRNTHVINQLKKANIPDNKIRRYTAIDGDTYSFSQKELDLFKNAFFLKTPSAKKLMGNQLSHFYIFKDMVEKGYNKILILQDDVVFRDGFIDHLNKICNYLPLNCEILNIGIHDYCYYNEFKAYDLTQNNDYLRVEKEKVNDIISLWKNTIQPCSLSYILTLTGAKNMISHFEKTGFLRETDMGFNQYLQSKNIFYGSRTVLCTGDPSFGTDIFNTEAWWKKPKA
jgi:glycosyltransferase involved in cell wall biosynthesis/GR25 family glycosyltransferase involved in LPS biosynthesis